MERAVMRIGFTGTRNGMTGRQRFSLRELLCEIAHPAVHVAASHGDCVGADEQFHRIVRETFSYAFITAHPGFPSRSRVRANCQADVIAALTDPHTRNAEIVRESDLLIAAPLDDSGKGGTWQTIRLARDKGMPVAIVKADGRIVRERWPSQEAA
jgi:hypothetical protein